MGKCILMNEDNRYIRRFGVSFGLYDEWRTRFALLVLLFRSLEFPCTI